MKKLINLFGITAILFLTSCTREVNAPATNNGNNSNGTVVTGNFSITRFTDNSSSGDKAADFAGYTFQFTGDGKIIAVKGSVTEQGTYTERPAHEGEGARLVINFGSQALSALNKNWLIVTITNAAIDLKDADPISNETLQFSAL